MKMIIDNRANISEKSNKRHSQEKPVESTTRYKEYEEYTCLKKVIHQRQQIDGRFLCRLGLDSLENCTRKENHHSAPRRKYMTKMNILNASINSISYFLLLRFFCFKSS